MVKEKQWTRETRKNKSKKPVYYEIIASIGKFYLSTKSNKKEMLKRQTICLSPFKACVLSINTWPLQASFSPA